MPYLWLICWYCDVTSLTNIMSLWCHNYDLSCVWCHNSWRCKVTTLTSLLAVTCQCIDNQWHRHDTCEWWHWPVMLSWQRDVWVSGLLPRSVEPLVPTGPAGQATDHAHWPSPAPPAQSHPPGADTDVTIYQWTRLTTVTSQLRNVTSTNQSYVLKGYSSQWEVHSTNLHNYTILVVPSNCAQRSLVNN